MKSGCGWTEKWLSFFDFLTYELWKTTLQGITVISTLYSGFLSSFRASSYQNIDLWGGGDLYLRECLAACAAHAARQRLPAIHEAVHPTQLLK